MNFRVEWKNIILIISLFLVFYFLPVDNPIFRSSIFESLYLIRWYAREHVLLCLVPAFFIAGAISVFLSKESVLKYLGAEAKKIISYGVASVSGTILAVCSCTVLPLFTGIYRMGAGLGPAIAFLYSGPSINILAIILTAKVLGLQIGIARAIGAIVFSIVIGLIMHFLFLDDEKKKIPNNTFINHGQEQRSLLENALLFFILIAILVFINWGKSTSADTLWNFIYDIKWYIVSFLGVMLSVVLYYFFDVKLIKLFISFILVMVTWFYTNNHLFTVGIVIVLMFYLLNTSNDEAKDWLDSSWDFAKQILPLLFFGVLVAGFLLGRPGHEGVIPSEWINKAVGGNSIFSNFFASVVGAFMYFATLTEIPILQGLLSNGMGKGPALALLLAGPALSLPNMLVIRSVIGTKKTIVYISLVVVMAMFTGLIFGMLV